MPPNILSASMLEKPCQSSMMPSLVLATCSVAASKVPPFHSGTLSSSLSRFTKLVFLFMSHCHSAVYVPLNVWAWDNEKFIMPNSIRAIIRFILFSFYYS